MGKIIDHNNFWYIEKNPITKTGVFPYLGREIGYPGLEPNKIYYVLRSEQELMSPEAIKSFELLPITKGHRMLGPAEQGLTPAEKIPQQGVVGEKVFAEGDTLYANIKVTSEQAKDDINKGLKELSLGYFCQWAQESGDYKGQHYDFVQKNIRGNHLAIVPLGRMGHDVRVMDALPAGAASYACDSLELAGPFVSALIPAGHIPLKLFNLPGQAQDWQESDHPRKKNGEFAPKGQSESGKAKNEEKTEKQDIFTPSAELTEKFKNNVQDILLDKEAHNYKKIDMGIIPQLYIELGLPKQNLKISKLSLKKALGLLTEEELEENPQWHNHNVPRNVIDNLPVLISDPLAVFKSLSTSTNPNGFVSVLDETNEDGKQIIAIINPSKKNNGFTFIPSVYERDDFDYFVKQTKAEGKILYVDKERASLPETLMKAATVGNKALIDSIQTKEKIFNSKKDLTKESEVKPMKKDIQDAWEEGKHPRDKDGKFTNGGGSTSGAKKEMSPKTEKDYKGYTIYREDDKERGNGQALFYVFEGRKILKQNLSSEEKAKEYIDNLNKTNGQGAKDASPEKEEAKMDKREVIREIMAISARPVSEFKGGEEEKVDTISKLAEKLAYNPSETGANDEDPKDGDGKKTVKEDAKDACAKDDKSKAEAEKGKKEDDPKAAMDAMEARIAANFAKKASLYEKISPFIGTFDHNPMSFTQMAKYACDKLGIKGIAEDGAETALIGYLAGAKKANIVREEKGAACDAFPGSDPAFKKYLEEAQ